MGQLPITSRLKRVPSVLKATGTPKAKVIKKGDDKIVKNTKTITTPGSVKASDDQCKPGDTRASCIALSKMSQEEIQAAEVARGDRVLPSTSQITTESTEKGDDVIADTYSKRTGDVLTNFDGRQKGRATKFTNKYVRQSQNKLARADDRMAKFKNKNMKDGVFTAPEAGQKGFKKYSRLKNKQTENTNELADFKVGASNQAESMRTGKKIGSGNVRRDVDRQDTAGDQTPEQRIAQVAAENNITTASTGQASKAINAPSSEGGKSQFDVGEIESFDPTKFGQYKSPASKRGYAMKGKNPAPAKSVLKKSYFKNK
tara:strand:- start:3269 stop:4213 length:945 start_codon:yes stop_codon:yes gene_type:complete